jgi:hypothetical protein
MLKISTRKTGGFVQNVRRSWKKQKDESITTFILLISETTLIKKK